MKKILFSLVMAATLMVSCQDNYWNIFGKDSDVNVVLKVTSPHMGSTRSDAAGLDSALGAIDNFDRNEMLWEEYDLRYILKIYEVVTAGATTTTSEQAIYSDTIIQDRYDSSESAKGITFKTRLVPQRKYKFVIWADFVKRNAQGAIIMEHYNVADMRNITRMTDFAHTAMEEALDAYHISFTEEIDGAVSLNAQLTRPMAKLRVVATDAHEISGYSIPAKVDVTFDTEINPVYRVFDAVSNALPIEGNCTECTYSLNVNPAPYNDYTGTTEEGEAITGVVLFSDYFFAQRPINENDNEQAVSFSMDIYDHKELPIRSIKFDTNIPISRNHLTTIVGNCLTQSVGIDIKIDDTLLNHTETFEGGDDYDIE